MRVLVVGDEVKLADLLKEGLEDEQFSVSLTFDTRTGVELATFSEFDAIVLDFTVVLDGFEFVRSVRRNQNQTPILMLTARNSITDTAMALDLGADDFVTKPFSFVELLARLRAIVHRRPGPRSPSLKVADLNLELATRRVCRGDHEIHLSRTEYKLLEFLMRRAGHVVSRDAIVEGVWGCQQRVEENTLDAFIHLLRIRVDRGFSPRLIQTIKGVGYSIREAVEA